MKKVVYSLSVVTLFSFISCGGGDSSNEAKELLKRILYLVGIPQDLVINICQNDNRNSVCDDFEIQTKIILNKNDNLESILSKIIFTENGEYILESDDPTKPLLLELQDIENIKYDDGKFFFHFNGLEENQYRKELSILESAIDAKYLTSNSVENIRNLKLEDAQNRFYQMLLKVFEENLNVLRDRLNEPNVSYQLSTALESNGYNPLAEQAIRDDLIEISRGLIENGIEDKIPTMLNECNGDINCIDTILEDLYNKLKISQERAEEIYPNLVELNEANSSESNVSSEYNGVPENAFITIWKTTNSGISSLNQITIQTDGDGYNYGIDWGDGTYDLNLTETITHTYDVEGEYTVAIFGTFPKIAFGKGSDGNLQTVENDARKIISIVKWGDIGLKSLDNSFMESLFLKGGASDIPNLSNVTSAKYTFYGATSFNDDISNWDISNITDTSYMFAYAYDFNQNIGSWDVSNVTNMEGMFKEARSFDQDLSGWKIGKVRNMKYMFSGISLSIINYDYILKSWAYQVVTPSIVFDAGYSIYSCDAQEARDRLTGIWGWRIFDGGSSSDCNSSYAKLSE